MVEIQYNWKQELENEHIFVKNCLQYIYNIIEYEIYSPLP